MTLSPDTLKTHTLPDNFDIAYARACNWHCSRCDQTVSDCLTKPCHETSRYGERIFVDENTYYYTKDVVNPSDYIPNGEFNPHKVRPWLVGNEYGVLAIVYASCEQDALDEAVDNDKLNGHLVTHDNCKYLGNDAWNCGHIDNAESCDCHVCNEENAHLGNADEPFDLTNIWMRELPNKQYARIRKHFIAMSGDHGCLPDYCDVFVTYQDAVDALADMFSLGRTRKARLFADHTLELNNERDGAEYCEITECTCDNPAKHSDNGVDLNDYIIRDEQTEAKYCEDCGREIRAESRPTSNYSIDRAHTLDCASQTYNVRVDDIRTVKHAISYLLETYLHGKWPSDSEYVNDCQDAVDLLSDALDTMVVIWVGYRLDGNEVKPR